MTRAFVAPAAAAAMGALLGWQLGAIAMEISVGATLIALSLVRRIRRVETDSDHQLIAHLARARRRDERTDVLVARFDPSTPAVAHRLKANLRVTDSACIVADRSALELRVMVDRERLDRHALERRLRSLTADPLQIGWSQFPEDGFTLLVLIDAAHQACHPVQDRDVPGYADQRLASELAPAEPVPLPITAALSQEVASR